MLKVKIGINSVTVVVIRSEIPYSDVVSMFVYNGRSKNTRIFDANSLTKKIVVFENNFLYFLFNFSFSCYFSCSLAKNLIKNAKTSSREFHCRDILCATIPRKLS